MGAFDYQSVLASLDASDALSEEVKTTMRDLIRKTARENGVTALEVDERVEFARHLLNVREKRPVIRNRLMARFGTSKRTAERDITAALQLRQKQGFHGTKVSETKNNEEVTMEQ